MNKFTIFTLKALHRTFVKMFVPDRFHYDRGIENPDEASDYIYNALAEGIPCMIARYGSTELNALMNYIGVERLPHNPLRYVLNKQPQWWWNEKGLEQLMTNAGFYPPHLTFVRRFGELMLSCTKDVDVLGSWLPDEQFLYDHYGLSAQKISILYLEPYWGKRPWSRILEGKKVLVVHPFAPLIERQYNEKREKLFSGRDVLPEFELKTIQAVQSLGGTSQYADWFEALAHMEHQMDAVDYDIALIGCGAYGFPLAAHAKRTGHQAIHLGGVLQLLFGIRGKRWDDPNYGIQEFGVQNKYQSLFNNAWVYPDDTLKPASADNVEGGCYW